MNYDWKYDAINGADCVLGAASGCGSTTRSSSTSATATADAVIMGGDDWGTGGHLEAPARGEPSRRARTSRSS